MKTAVVTGACGFIGKALVRALLARGGRVCAFVRDQAALADLACPQLQVCALEFQQYGRLSSFVREEVDTFYHFAWAGVSGSSSQDVSVQLDNITAACQALEQAAALKTDVFVFAGSSYEYRMEPVQLKGGETVEGCRSVYGAAKKAGGTLLRALALQKGIRMINVAFTNVYGVGDASRRSANVLIGRLLRGEPLDLIPGDHPHDWTYIDDAIEGILSAADRGKAMSSYYIGSRKIRTFREIITEIRDILAPEAELRFGAYADPSYIDYSRFDLDALYRDTGFQARCDFKSSIEKTAGWLRRIS